MKKLLTLALSLLMIMSVCLTGAIAEEGSVVIENNGRTTTYDSVPERVVVLSYSNAETMAALGLEDKVVAAFPGMYTLDDVLPEYQEAVAAMGSFVSLGIAIVVRMLQGEERILFFSAVWQVFGVIAILIVLRYVLMKQKSLAAERCGLGIKKDVRMGLLNKLFMLGPAFINRERTGNIASSISTKVEYLNDYYTIYLPNAVACIVNAVLIVTGLTFLNRVSAGICIIACVGMFGCPMLFYFIMRRRGEEEISASGASCASCESPQSSGSPGTAGSAGTTARCSAGTPASAVWRNGSG